MFFPDELWRKYLSDKPIIPVILMKIASLTSAVATVTVEYQIPQEYDAIVTNLSGRFSAGAAQTTQSVALRVLHMTGATIYIRHLYNITTQSANLDWSGQFYLQRECKLQAIGGFSGAVAANTVDVSIMGLLVPKNFMLQM